MLKPVQIDDEKLKHLPYSSVIDNEASRQFQEIKTHLGLCITYREIGLPLSFWLDRLSSYIDLYKLKFSKSDHVLLIELLYDLLTVPNLPLNIISIVHDPLIKLLKKPRLLLPREDLTLPWKPLYNLCKRIDGGGHYKIILVPVPSDITANLEELIAVARLYFDPADTQEILDELRPLLCPLDTVAIKYAVRMLSAFLPITNSPELAESTYKLWLAENMRLWEACSNNPYCDDIMMCQLAKLASLNIGDIDWDDYFPTMYARFQRIFGLPVYYKKVGYPGRSEIVEDGVALWIVATLGGGSRSQEYLDQLLGILESYCQSANEGSWTNIIKSFLTELVECFIERIRRERFKEPFWKRCVPEHKRLTDEDVRRFVLSMQSIAMSAIFSVTFFAEFSPIFQELADLRPDIVIPPLLDRLYATIDCVTEPHKLTAVLQCVSSVARPMLSGGLNHTYPEGKKHVIPLLFAVLPGIDSIDPQKSLATLEFISTFLEMIPVVDCSSSSQFFELTEIEEEVASATSQFEEFVLQFMDRIFMLTESIAQENVGNDDDDGREMEEHILLLMTSLEECCYSVFSRISPEIFKVALKKLYNYTMVKVLEIEIAGQVIASLLQVFAQIDAQQTYRIFIPTLSTPILEATRSQEVKNEEHLDQEFLYKMLLLTSVVYSRSPLALKPYLSTLTNVLDETLHAKCKKAHLLSLELLQDILRLLSYVSPLNYFGTLPENASQTFLIREWGQGITFEDLSIQWYCPGEEEISIVEQIFWKYLMPELKKIDEYNNNNEVDYSRDDIRHTLGIITVLLRCFVLLKPWTEESLINETRSSVPYLPLQLELGVQRYILMPDGSNVFKVLIDKMGRFQSKLLHKSDDTTAFTYLTKIWTSLLYQDDLFTVEYASREEYLKSAKQTYVNRVRRSKSNLRRVLTEEVILKHYQRVTYNQNMLTQTHKIVFVSLFDLATSDYKKVRMDARALLQFHVDDFADNTFLINGIVDNLKLDTTEYKEKFKGTVALLKSGSYWFDSFSSSFEQLKVILPAIVTSKPSEEIVIINLLSRLDKNVLSAFWQFAIPMKIPDYVVDKAKKLWTEFELLRPLPSDEDIRAGQTRLENENKKRKSDFEELVTALMEAVDHKNLQWRYELMAAHFLVQSWLPNEEDLPSNVARYFLNLLIHDSSVLRQFAVSVIPKILKRYKAKTRKEVVDPFTLGETDSADCKCLIPGPRSDNAWCRYSEKYVPKTEVEWDEARYSYHCYLGFYGWPKEMRLCSSPTIQPMNNVDFDTLSGVGKEIDLFFLNQSKVAKLIEYSCLEEKKNQPLRYSQIQLFKYLFKIHCDRYLEIFKPHLERILARKEDSYQLCAAEMLSGIITGTKLWPFDKAQELIKWYVPLLKQVLDEMPVETHANWGSAIAGTLVNFDVNKNSHLLDLLMEEPIRGDALMIKNCGRLYVLQTARIHSWRLSEIWRRLLEYIKPHLANSYQNLRARLASVLCNIFETDIESSNWNRTLAPKVSDFINYLLPKLDVLYNITPNSDSSGNYSESGGGDGSVDKLNDEELEAIQLLKTVCSWCTEFSQMSVYPLKPDFYRIFPLLCFMENYDKDDELKLRCKYTLSQMCYAIVLIKDIPVFLDAFDKVCDSNSWCAKCTGLDFLQVFMVHNLFLVSSREEWISRIIENVLRLLVDNRCEVRQKAGVVLSGFFHYRIIKDPSELIEKFKVFSSASVKEKKSNLNMRHAGVIGLCSFINAYPYTVPPEVPPLFADIGSHLKDPEPIPDTIRKTLGNFKRTHYADWEQSKLKFTADQLEVLADLVIPPNHYA